MNIKKFEESIYDLIVSCSTEFPWDVRHAIKKAMANEIPGTSSALSLEMIAENINMADELCAPICQDTGLPNFRIKVPVNVNQIELTTAIENAVVTATENGKLRPNSVDSLTGKNSGNNLGINTPIIKFEQWEKDYIEIKLLMKGGGSENKSIQYSLPAEIEGLGRAARDLNGIRKCILHSIYQAQGQGCSAGFIGVGIGSDRSSGYAMAKLQLFRELTDENPIEELKNLEEYVVENCNKLGIGAMGFGGANTLLGCKIGIANRIPASFFVSVLYNCWAFRRAGVKIDANNGEIIEWHYKNGEKLSFKPEKSENEHDNVIKIKAPVSEETVRSLKVGDVVEIDGMIYTGRDEIHKHISKYDCEVDLDGQIIYHCGPVMLKDENGVWSSTAAGPTTSIREEPYQGDVMKKVGLRVVVGKGGMGENTLKVLNEHGGVYLNAIGGAAQYYADCIKSIDGVNYLGFGVPEAMWHMNVKGFRAVVTMDSHMNSLHKEIEKSSFEKLKDLK